MKLGVEVNFISACLSDAGQTSTVIELQTYAGSAGRGSFIGLSQVQLYCGLESRHGISWQGKNHGSAICEANADIKALFGN